MTPAPSIAVTLDDGRVLSVADKTRVGDLLPSRADPANGLPYLGALVDHELVTFSFKLYTDARVSFVTLADKEGWRMYVRSLTLLLAKTLRDLFPDAVFTVDHSIGSDLYCDFSRGGRAGLSDEDAAALLSALRAAVAADQPIRRVRLPYAKARDVFRDQPDKLGLLDFLNTPKVTAYCLDGFYDLAAGPMTSSTGVLPLFDILPYADGFVLRLPRRDTAPEIPPFKPIRVLTEVFREYNRWGRILGVETVGDLNRIVASGGIRDFIKVNESLHEKKIAQIADRIAGRGGVRCVLIAGPSSSGKTTFARRLAIQLRVNGLRPVTMGTDDYFVDRAHTPRSADGSYDFEHIRAVDIDQLNRDLNDLSEGKEIRVPTFDFKTGQRIYTGKTIRLAPDEVLLLEGIHSLNPALTPSVPAEKKFLVYISALTQLNLDRHNRIPTSDNRLLRRIVRDYAYRGHSVLATLSMWPNVGAGEEKWIFPFQDNADAVFNTALDYELGVLAHHAIPLLRGVKPGDPNFPEALRMLRFLDLFLPISDALPPPTSILREFIGGSSFDY